MRKYLLSILFVIISVALSAQNSIKVEAPNVVAADEQFNVSFTIEGENTPSDFTWSAGDDFQVVWGPQKGSSTSISIVNGKRTTSKQSTFTYILMPKSTGSFTLPEATATVKGKSIVSTPKTITVVSGGSSSSSSSSSNASSSSTGEISSDDLFLRFTLSKNRVVVGEPVSAELKLYQRVNIAGFEDAKFPAFNGFWSQETFAPTNIEFTRESVGDNIYNTAVLRSYVLIPQQSGNITIDPAELVCLVNIRSARSQPMSIFDSFFQDDYRTIRKRVTSDAVTVHVSALPSGAPSSFHGGVGAFTIKAEVSKDELKAHEAASLIVTVSGSGNLSLLEAPSVDFPSDFEIYDVKQTESTDKSGGKISGTKTFEYPFIPRSHGEFTIPAIEYTYYNVSSSKYVTVKTEDIYLDVQRGVENSSSTGQMFTGTVRKDVKDLGSDIRYISTKSSSLTKEGDFFFGSVLFFVLILLSVGIAIAYYFAIQKVYAMRKDVVGSRNRGATKMAQKRLSTAKGYLENNLYSAFYEELHKALLGFVSDKLNLSASDMNRDTISSSLSERGVNEGLIKEFTDLLDACEFARYAPSSGHETMSSHYNTAVSVISSIDSSMKGNKNTSAKTLITILTVAAMLPFSSSVLSARETDGLWEEGVSAYASGDWTSALDSWKSIESSGYVSDELFTNIADAYFKASDYAHAVLYYERALKLNPSNADARFNLEFTNAMIQDKIDTVPEFFLKTWNRKVCWLLSSDSWAILFLVFFAMTLALILYFILSMTPLKRRMGFFGAILFLVLSLFSFSFSWWQKSDYNTADSAVIVVPVSSVKSSPDSDSSKNLFVLHEGTKVRLIDEIGSWKKIELSDGRQGWAKSQDLEII